MMDVPTSFTRLSSKGQITLPKAVRRAVGLEQGDPVKVEVIDEGTIVLRPQKVIDASQAWFWSPDWQTGEAKASADIKAGRTTIHKSSEDFLDALSD